MKRISKDKWTDGEHLYSGNPKDGFTKIGDEKRAQEIVEAIRNREENNVVEMEAHSLQAPKMDKLTVDTDDKE